MPLTLQLLARYVDHLHFRLRPHLFGSLFRPRSFVRKRGPYWKRVRPLASFFAFPMILASASWSRSSWPVSLTRRWHSIPVYSAFLCLYPCKYYYYYYSVCRSSIHCIHPPIIITYSRTREICWRNRCLSILLMHSSSWFLISSLCLPVFLLFLHLHTHEAFEKANLAPVSWKLITTSTTTLHPSSTHSILILLIYHFLLLSLHLSTQSSG